MEAERGIYIGRRREDVKCSSGRNAKASVARKEVQNVERSSETDANTDWSSDRPRFSFRITFVRVKYMEEVRVRFRVVYATVTMPVRL